MYFLEYVYSRLVGEPLYGKWACVYCGRQDKVTIAPRQKDGKVRFKCWAGSCSEWGDELDLIEWIEGRHKRPDQLHRVRELWAEFKAAGGIDSAHGLGRGAGPQRKPFRRARLPANVFDELTADQIVTLADAFEIAHMETTDLTELAEMCFAYVRRMDQEQREHDRSEAVKQTLRRRRRKRNTRTD